jgi:viologen exporter family transport system permease protein
MGVSRIIRLYFRFLGTHLRAALEYESDFWLMVVAALVTQVVNIVVLKLIFTRIPDLHGWTFSTIIMMFGMVTLSEGVVNVFFEGMWRLAYLIHFGQLDQMVVRPFPVPLQVCSAEIGLNGVGNVIAGIAWLVIGLLQSPIDWSVSTAVISIVLFISALAVKVAISLATNAVSFWVKGPNPLFAMAVHQAGELTRYPLKLYPFGLQLLLGVAVPLGFVSFFPATYLTSGHPYGWIGLLTPLVAAYCVGMAAWIFHRGLLRYESTGS